jgi:hypothetical protein
MSLGSIKLIEMVHFRWMERCLKWLPVMMLIIQGHSAIFIEVYQNLGFAFFFPDEQGYDHVTFKIDYVVLFNY